MSMYSLLRNDAYCGQLTVDDMEINGGLDGNWRRRIGYQLTPDVAKTLVEAFRTRMVSYYAFPHIRIELISCYLSTTLRSTPTMERFSLTTI
jgi:hypothetical protein